MSAELAALLGSGRETMLAALFVFLRVAPIIGFAPGFGEMVVPVRVKLALALCFTLALLPLVAPLSQESGTAFIEAAAQEGAIGLFLGLALRFFIITLQTAGSMAAQATSLAQLFAGAATEPMPAIGHLLVIAGLALAMLMGLPVRLIAFVDLSYRAMPASGGVDMALLSEWAAGLASHAFALAFSMAVPFLLMSLLYNLTLGVINRAMPQLMVAFVGAPVITAGGLIFLMVFAPIMLSSWWQAFVLFLEFPAEFGR